MPSFTRSIAIRRSPEQVFAVLDDLGQAPDWMPAIRRIDILTPGMRMGVGFKWRETRRILGVFRKSFVLVVTSHDPPRTWGLTYNDGKVQATATFELKPTAAGTEVAFSEEVEDLQGKPARAERMAKMMENQDAELLDRLKAHVEATSEEPAGLAPDPLPAQETPNDAGKEKVTAAKPARAATVTRSGKPSAAPKKAKAPAKAAKPKKR